VRGCADKQIGQLTKHSLLTSVGAFSNTRSKSSTLCVTTHLKPRTSATKLWPRAFDGQSVYSLRLRDGMFAPQLRDALWTQFLDLGTCSRSMVERARFTLRVCTTTTTLQEARELPWWIRKFVDNYNLHAALQCAMLQHTHSVNLSRERMTFRIRLLVLVSHTLLIPTAVFPAQ